MTITEFIKKYTPSYKERELKMIRFYELSDKEIPFSESLKRWREGLFQEALVNYTEVVFTGVFDEFKPTIHEASNKI